MGGREEEDDEGELKMQGEKVPRVTNSDTWDPQCRRTVTAK